jgi:hypothetical protein
MATVKFKNHVIDRPSNVSMKLIKRVCLELGEDYNFTVNDVIQCISRLNSHPIEGDAPLPDVTNRILIFEVNEA